MQEVHPCSLLPARPSLTSSCIQLFSNPPAGVPAPSAEQVGAAPQVPFTKAHVQAHPEYEYMKLPHYFSANSAPWYGDTGLD